MTKRVVVFRNTDGTLFATPEFNGDKEEFKMFKMRDTCTSSWEDILKIFADVKTLMDFRLASIRAQMCYKNMFGNFEISSIREVDDIGSIASDEVHTLSA